MSTYCRAALSALVSFALVGCASAPISQSLSPKVAAAMQPVDVKIGIYQPELYAAFEPSATGSGAAAVCGAIPGIGILLAAACGGAMGAVDAGINASRAKVADAIVRPLKDEIVDLKVDQMMSESLTKSLQGVQGMQFASIVMTKIVNDKAYAESFQASTSAAVMFVNIDYHISKDFSTLEISARGTMYPRSEAARKAAGLPESASNDAKEPALPTKNTVYRANVFYHAKLPTDAAQPSEYVAAWKADGARLLRSGLNDGTVQVGRLLAEDLRRNPDAARTVLAKVDIERGLQADLISESNGGKLLRYPDGSLHFKTTTAASAYTAEPLKVTATSSASGTASQ